MTNEEIIDKLEEMRIHYDEENWTMYDLQNDLEEIFMELEKRNDQLS